MAARKPKAEGDVSDVQPYPHGVMIGAGATSTHIDGVEYYVDEEGRVNVEYEVPAAE
jgi:hypothetical protein